MSCTAENPRLNLNSWMANSAKVAVAAGVAFAFLLGVQGGNDLSVSPIQVASSVNDPGPSASVPEGFELPPLNARTVSTSSSFVSKSSPVLQSNVVLSELDKQAVNQEFEKRLNSLMLEHTQSVSVNGAMSVLPYTRVVDLDAAKD